MLIAFNVKEAVNALAVSVILVTISFAAIV
jgi:hypothetical protein